MNIFFSEGDRTYYLRTMRAQARAYGVEILVYCLMTNHVHLVAVPSKEDSFARAVGETHRLYTRRINFRDNVRGHLFQERFHSSVLDETHLLYAVRYVEMNPVRAGIVRQAWQYRWSSAAYHLQKIRRDALVSDRSLFSLAEDWNAILYEDRETDQTVRQRTKTGRPCGDRRFLRKLEDSTGRPLCPRKPGPRASARC